MMEFMFLKSFGEMIGQLDVSANCHYFNFNLSNIFQKKWQGMEMCLVLGYILVTVSNLRHELLSSWTMDG